MTRFLESLPSRRRLPADREAGGRHLVHDGARALPGLLICGARSCGTGAMHQALVQHPTVFGPVSGSGVHYFDLASSRGLEWYRAQFPPSADLDRARQAHRTPALALETSDYYLFHPGAARRVAADLPGARVLVLVRDPVERARAAHAEACAQGLEDLDLAEALRREDDRMRGETVRLSRDPAYRSPAHRHLAYREQGEYAPQIQRFAALLGPDRVKVVDSDRLFAEPGPVLTEVLAWLGIAPRGRLSVERDDRTPVPPIDPELRAELSDYFLPYDVALTRWLGHVPTWRQ